MNFDNVPDFVMRRERARGGRLLSQQQTAEAMGCPWRSYQRWMQRWRESELWASQQVVQANAPRERFPSRREDAS
jgi:hypothetical protein